MPFKERIEKIAVEIYGAKGVTYSEKALTKIRKIDSNPNMRQLEPVWLKRI